MKRTKVASGPLAPLLSRNQLIALAAALIVLLIGAYMLVVGRAAVPFTSTEAESAALASNTERVTDAQASGGQAIAFRAATQPPPGGRTVNVSTSAQLTAAFADARAGDVINLADGNYTGKLLSPVPVGGKQYTGSFVATNKSGTATAPITLKGSRNASIDGDTPGGHYGLYLVNSNYWVIDGISVGTATKGIVLDGSNHVKLNNLKVSNTGQEAVHFRAFSSDNIISNSEVTLTGQRSEGYGEGVYLGSANSNWPTYTGGQPDTSDRNQVINNTISYTNAEGIDVKEGTSFGIIRGNHFDHAGISGKNSADSFIDVKGNDYLIENNTGSYTYVDPTDPADDGDGYQVHNVYNGWAQRNIFKNNLSDPHTAGYGFNIVSTAMNQGNLIYCNNTFTNAAKGLANIPCTP